MKEIFHKISSVLVAFSVLFSTLSFTVDKHYCGGKLVEISVFSEIEGCGMEMETKKESFDIVTISKKPCCKDETSIIEGVSVDQQALQKLKIEQVNFITTYLVSYINLFVNNNTQISLNGFYKPPLIGEDITILLENFRI